MLDVILCFHFEFNVHGPRLKGRPLASFWFFLKDSFQIICDLTEKKNNHLKRDLFYPSELKVQNSAIGFKSGKSEPLGDRADYKSIVSSAINMNVLWIQLVRSLWRKGHVAFIFLWSRNYFLGNRTLSYLLHVYHTFFLNGDPKLLISFYSPLFIITTTLWSKLGWSKRLL